MKIFVINLKRATERRDSMVRQLAALGVSAEFVEAVDGRQLTSGEIRAAVNRFRWWCAIGRLPRLAEIGCALSHYGLYRQMRDEAVCILEDDVVLSESFVRALREVEAFVDVQKPQVVLLSDQAKQYATDPRAGVVESDYGLCTDGYVLTPAAARALLKGNLPMIVPCDHWRRWWNRKLIELYHFLPCVVSQDRESFGSSTQGGVVRTQELPILRRLPHYVGRLIGRTIDRLAERIA